MKTMRERSNWMASEGGVRKALVRLGWRVVCLTRIGKNLTRILLCSLKFGSLKSLSKLGVTLATQHRLRHVSSLRHVEFRDLQLCS